MPRDRPHPISDGQLQWQGAVSFGGQVVTFTMFNEDVETGNFPDERHVFGITLIAPNAVEVDKINLDTNGFYFGHTLEDRDVHTLMHGPGAPGGPTAPVPEPTTFALLALGLGGAILHRRRARR